ncbi:MAG: hypothetical protein AB2557_18940 [Candidatus Thiodiazotropha sp.]
MEFSEELGRRPITYDKQAVRHQFAFKNIGKRSIINIRLKARVRIKLNNRRGDKIINYFDVSLSNNEIFEMKPGVMFRMSLDVHKSSTLDTPLLNESVVEKLHAKTLTVDDVLDFYHDASFFVQIIGTDIYSNATKVFQSPQYKKADIRSGVFTGQSLDIAPLDSWGIKQSVRNRTLDVFGKGIDDAHNKLNSSDARTSRG